MNSLYGDPLCSVGGRFALGPPKGIIEDDNVAPSPTGIIPFGLRFLREFGGSPTRVPGFRYCPQRQVAVLADDSEALVFRHTNPKTQATSEGHPDSNDPNPKEETRPDWQPH